MAAFKKPGRPGYHIRPSLPDPWGRVGPWQTGFNSKRQADTVEAWVQEMALTRPELIDALVRGDFSLRTAWVAKLRGTLDDLIRGITDPPVATVAEAFAETVKDGRVRDGLRELAELADRVERARAEAENRKAPRPGALRVSWLLDPQNVNALYRVALEGGRSANSVKRSVHRAVADLLADKYGKARRNDLMAEVTKPSEDDERKVKVSPEEIGAALHECDSDFVDLPALAILLAVDRGPLLRITPRYFHEAKGTLEVLDTKTDTRARTIELSAPALSILRRRCQGRGQDEPIFEYTEDQVRHRWDAARDRAAGNQTRNKRERARADAVRERAEALLEAQGVVTLPILRFKDLRHLLPTAWNALGFSETDLQDLMGHAKGSTQTRRYTTARVSGERRQMDEVAAFLGLDRLHLKAAGE